MNKIDPPLEGVLFHIIEKTIKSYRQFAQRNLKDVNEDITLDQWLILKTIADNPEATQREIAQNVFKDHASVTRMVDLLVKKGFIERSIHTEDRRRFGLKITSLGKMTQREAIAVVLQNRAIALQGLSETEIKTLGHLLQKITDNCTNTIHQKAKQS